MDIQPNYEARIFGGQALVLGFGPGNDDFNWSLKGLKEVGDEDKPENAELMRRLGLVGVQLNTDIVLAPHPTDMNSEIVGHENMTELLHLPIDGAPRIRFLRGPKADGVRLSMDESFMMSSADCALVVVKWREQMWAAHAGRDSLIDRKLIASGGAEKGKRYGSVVDSIMAEIPQKFWEETEVYYGCTISAGEHFAHPIDHPEPKYAEFNKKMLDYIAGKYYGPNDQRVQTDAYRIRGQIDMQSLIRRQFECYGVSQFETDNVCTFSDRTENGSFKWHSNRRDKVKRNLFAVARR